MPQSEDKIATQSNSVAESKSIPAPDSQNFQPLETAIKKYVLHAFKDFSVSVCGEFPSRITKNT